MPKIHRLLRAKGCQVETFVGETSYDEKDSKAYAALMDRLWDEALTDNDARQLIRHAAEQLTTNT